MKKSYVGELQKTAERQIERRLRAAILKLADQETDIFIERWLMSPGGTRDSLYEEGYKITEHITQLRGTLAMGRTRGYHLCDRDEDALRAAAEGRGPRRKRSEPEPIIPPTPVEPRRMKAPRSAAPPSSGPRALGGAPQLPLLPASTRSR